MARRAILHTTCHSTTTTTLKLATQDKLRVPITVIPALFSYFLSLTPLVSQPRTRPNGHKPPPHGNRTLALLPRSSSPFMCLHLPYSFPVTDTPEVAATIHNLDTADRQRACISLSFHSLRRGSITVLQLSGSLSHLLFHFTHLRALASRGRPVEPRLGRSPLFSPYPFSLSFTLSLVLG
jgi:hypothetical protein